MGPRNSIIFDKKNLFCNVDPTAVIESIDASSIYQVPMLMKQEKLDEVVLKKLKITVYPKPNLESWEEFLYKLKNPEKEVTIGLVGKYVELKDAYKSIIESFIHAGTSIKCKVNLKLIHSESLDDENIDDKLKDLKGILVA